MSMSLNKGISGAAARLGVLVAVTLALIAIVACGSAAEPEATVAPAATEAPAAASTNDESSAADAESEAPAAMLAPTFELPNAKGETVSLASYAGERNVVLVFYRGFW